MSGVRSLRRGAAIVGSPAATSAPVYVNSSTNDVKAIVAGSGSTEVALVDKTTAQTLTNKTLTAPTITAPTISGAGTVSAQINTDIKALAADFTAASGGTGSTLTSLTGVSWSVIAGATYRFRAVVPLVTMTTNGGFQMALKLTTATLTSVNFRVRQSTDTDNTGAVSTSFVSTTDQATFFNQKAVVYTQAVVEGTFVVGVAGSIAVQAAQNTSHVDTTTITAGAVFELVRVL